MTIAAKPIERIHSAHPLFPPEQAFLWLPGFAGDERPYCSYNEYREGPTAYDNERSALRQTQDPNGAFYAPPFPVSRETHICWHTHVTPPFPYHPIPITRTLSAEEISNLEKRVRVLLGDAAFIAPAAGTVLRNEFKCRILVALAEMKLLPAPPTEKPETLRPAG